MTFFIGQQIRYTRRKIPSIYTQDKWNNGIIIHNKYSLHENNLAQTLKYLKNTFTHFYKQSPKRDLEICITTMYYLCRSTVLPAFVNKYNY